MTIINNGLVPAITLNTLPPQKTPPVPNISVNATQITGISIDLSDLGDGKVLSFNAGTGEFVFVTPSGGGGGGPDCICTDITFPNAGVISGDAETTSIAHSIDIYTPGLVQCGGIQSCGGGGDSFLNSVTSISGGGSTITFNGETNTTDFNNTITANSGIDVGGSNIINAGSVSSLGYSTVDISENPQTGATGTFTTVDGKSVTVTNGIVTAIDSGS